MSEYPQFFRQAMKKEPFPYQVALADSPEWPDLLNVATGMGKTAAVTLGWLWKRGWRRGERRKGGDLSTPRRLVWCLPMRVLVEQTYEDTIGWLDQLGLLAGKAVWETRNGERCLKSYVANPDETGVSVHLLMGGESDLKSWAEHPEEDMILIGTQDMLLSRALMRGYGMSRYQWPVHFALLHNDCFWVFDEVQLMGAGLATSAQIEAFRRRFPLAKNSHSLWVSATLNPDWLATVDMQPYVASLTTLALGDRDRELAKERLEAIKILSCAPVSLTQDNQKKQAADYLEKLAKHVLEQHDPHTQTLVIVNRVERAQHLFRLLQRKRGNKADLLIHARFRAAERAIQVRRLRDESATTDRIVVATQAIEAGVDISARTLITELAPWPSLVQRMGRCNRYGEHNAQGAIISWIDIDDDADALPYAADTLQIARNKLTGLASASPASLPATDEIRPLTAVLRCRDLLDLFNTDPDLSGFDVDVSDYIRDSGGPGVQVFWRGFEDDPNNSGLNAGPESKPVRSELCSVSIGQIRTFAKRKETRLWHWDALDRQWARLQRNPRPGMILLLRAADGGYDSVIGFDAGIKNLPTIIDHELQNAHDAFADDWRSRQNKPVGLSDHLGHVAKQASILCTALEETKCAYHVVRAGRWHDLGKVHEVFNATMHACDKAPAGFLAKSPCNGRHSRKYFRHELASMLGWLAQHDGESDADLIAYLILAHHGKVRMSLRAMPGEADYVPADTKRFARGVYEGDILPALDFDGEHSDETILKLALMGIGESEEQGRSWTERALTLLDQHGPFQLAWLETLVRLADWRASAAEQEEGCHE